MPVAIYARVSTEEQRERHSIDTQLNFGDRVCDLHKLSLVRVFPDNGVSGTVPLERRPEGSQMLAAARRGEFDQLLIYKLDRLGRDTRLILNAVADLEKLGVRVRSMTEEFDTSTATGKLMLTMLSGFASHEREVIRERSVAGTNRVAEAGAWMGGIVPYGYRKVGEKRDARLVVSDEIIAAYGMSESDVIRLIYRLAAIERRSCFYIADRLNELRVPCAYQRDDRLLLRGKRKQRTSGIWRPSRVRNIIVNPTYKGLHQFGKRTSNKSRPLITRSVPTIVDEKTWDKAQANLRAHQLYAPRSATHEYLLRGLIKCACCGLTFSAVTNLRRDGKREHYYRCNGKQVARGLFGVKGQRCPSKGVRGGNLEAIVWRDVEDFLRSPGRVINNLQTRLRGEASDIVKNRARVEYLQGLQEAKASERSKVVALFRKGRLNDSELDQQLSDIDREAEGLSSQLEALKRKLGSACANEAALEDTEALLTRLRKRLDESLSSEQRRQLVELLVGGIQIETIRSGPKPENIVTVTYRFPSVTENCTDTDSWRRSE
jgi:site-specific DNA recombinase